MARATRSARLTSSQESAQTSSAEAGPRVVVVDDNPDILNIVVLLLMGDGFRVSSTAFSQEAVAMMNTEPLHLVITDLRLADGDGTDVIRHAAQLTPRPPAIILLTAARTSEDASLSHLLASANVTLVQKPFDIDHLLDLARSLTGWPGSS